MEELDILGVIPCAVVGPLRVMFGHGGKLIRYR